MKDKTFFTIKPPQTTLIDGFSTKDAINLPNEFHFYRLADAFLSAVESRYLNPKSIKTLFYTSKVLIQNEKKIICKQNFETN